MSDTDYFTLTMAPGDEMRLFVSIQALFVFIDNDGQREYTRNGHRLATRNIEHWMGVTLPRNGRGQAFRRERIALVNALILAEAMGLSIPDRYGKASDWIETIHGDFPIFDIEGSI